MSNCFFRKFKIHHSTHFTAEPLRPPWASTPRRHRPHRWRCQRCQRLPALPVAMDGALAREVPTTNLMTWMTWLIQASRSYIPTMAMIGNVNHIMIQIRFRTVVPGNPGFLFHCGETLKDVESWALDMTICQVTQAHWRPHHPAAAVAQPPSGEPSARSVDPWRPTKLFLNR